MQLEPAIRNSLVELIGANFKMDQVNELGRLVLGAFDSNEAAGARYHVYLSPRKCAGLLVDHCETAGHVAELIKLVVEVDEETVRGRPVRIKGLEEFLGKLTRSGIHYDFKSHKVVTACLDPLDLPNWGCLKDGRDYEITIVSVDVVGNSAKVRKLGVAKMEKLYGSLWRFLREKLSGADGRIWSWAGDGGIIAFAFRDQAARAVRFAIELQSTIPVFNLSASGSPAGDVALRLGVHSGRMKFGIETATIVSDVIHFAEQLQKSATLPGTVTISRSVRDALPTRLASVFRFRGRFEQQYYFRTLHRLDTLLVDNSSDGRERPA